ncbi:MAG TPA: prolyl oligopeptidase family serine peptidase [Candidatus Cloacimonadota bacterium]|nr:prolyl oligopeptidase family serine peptidase [Candidatus Cloacimonadota bacterium]
MKYPKTKQENVSEEIFGVHLQDPYRWLENDHSEETEAWVKEQHKLTESILDEYADRKTILDRLLELNKYKKEGGPVKWGDWYYFSKNDGLQNQWVIYRKRTLDGEAELFFDPNALSEDGTTKAQTVGRSKNNKYFVYHISVAGADTGELWVMDTVSKTFLDDKLLNVRHTGASWYKEDGYFYSKYDSVEDYQKQNQNQKIYYHKLGDKQENDKLIYEDPEHPLRYNSARVSDDERYLFIYSGQGTHGNQVYFKSLEVENSELQILFEGYEYSGYVFDAYEKDTVYLFTNKNAKNFRLLKVNLLNPAETSWKEIIPERDYLLDSIDIAGGKLIAIFIKDMQSIIEILETDGKFSKSIELPYQGTAGFWNSKKEDTEGFFYFSSYIRPTEIFHYDFNEDKMEFYHRDAINADVTNTVSELVFYPSRDGAQIPMTLIYQKGMQKNKQNPVYLFGYGGFNVSLLPYFTEDRIPFLEKGGIYVVVNLRGGGEYGERWHEQGMLLNKQNVFDDFISAAEYLIQEGYSNPDKMAIAGGSNGGLLVGATMTQRPELFKVAVPMMGVLDMLRYHKFTCGWGWMVEYGNPDEEEHFHNLLKYSPLHNVREGVNYPATMVVTADHDDRVIPGHSFKFAATLQEKAKQELPLLLYTMIHSAHGPSSLTKQLEMRADVWSFVFKYLNM